MNKSKIWKVIKVVIVPIIIAIIGISQCNSKDSKIQKIGSISNKNSPTTVAQDVDTSQTAQTINNNFYYYAPTSTTGEDTISKNELASANKEVPQAYDESLKSQLDKYQSENKMLKDSLRQEKAKTFDLDQGSTPDGGIIIRSRKSSIAKKYNSALDEYLKGNLAPAKETLELILEVEPDEFKTMTLLGIILNELGYADKALVYLNKAYNISKDPMILGNIEIIKKNPGVKIPATVIDE
jgi:tetratricopeptide (TPR) repeat protein